MYNVYRLYTIIVDSFGRVITNVYFLLALKRIHVFIGNRALLRIVFFFVNDDLLLFTNLI